MDRCSTCAWQRQRHDERLERVYCAHHGRCITTLDTANMEAGNECPVWRDKKMEIEWQPRNLT